MKKEKIMPDIPITGVPQGTPSATSGDAYGAGIVEKTGTQIAAAREKISSGIGALTNESIAFIGKMQDESDRKNALNAFGTTTDQIRQWNADRDKRQLESGGDPAGRTEALSQFLAIQTEQQRKELSMGGQKYYDTLIRQQVDYHLDRSADAERLATAKYKQQQIAQATTDTIYQMQDSGANLQSAAEAIKVLDAKLEVLDVNKNKELVDAAHQHAGSLWLESIATDKSQGDLFPAALDFARQNNWITTQQYTHFKARSAAIVSEAKVSQAENYVQAAYQGDLVGAYNVAYNPEFLQRFAGGLDSKERRELQQRVHLWIAGQQQAKKLDEDQKEQTMLFAHPEISNFGSFVPISIMNNWLDEGGITNPKLREHYQSLQYSKLQKGRQEQATSYHEAYGLALNYIDEKSGAVSTDELRALGVDPYKIPGLLRHARGVSGDKEMGVFASKMVKVVTRANIVSSPEQDSQIIDYISKEWEKIKTSPSPVSFSKAAIEIEKGVRTTFIKSLPQNSDALKTQLNVPKTLQPGQPGYMPPFRQDKQGNWEYWDGQKYVPKKGVNIAP